MQEGRFTMYTWARGRLSGAQLRFPTSKTGVGIPSVLHLGFASAGFPILSEKKRLSGAPMLPKVLYSVGAAWDDIPSSWCGAREASCIGLLLGENAWLV